jgi:hypothetical protein
VIVVFATGWVTLARRTAETVTVVVEEVRVLLLAALLSVAIAVMLKVPGAVGVHVVDSVGVANEVGTTPTDTPFTRKSICVINAPALATADAVKVTEFDGEERVPRLPAAGAPIVTEVGGAEKAAGTAASNIASAAAAA